MQDWYLQFDTPDIGAVLLFGTVLLTLRQVMSRILDRLQDRASPALRRTSVTATAAIALVIAYALREQASRNAPGLLFLFGAAAVWTTLRSYAIRRGAAPTPVRLLLIVLRLSATLVVLFLLLRPSIGYEHTLFEKPIIAVVLDSSSSMSTRDVLDDEMRITRAAAAQRAFTASSGLIDSLSERNEVRTYNFGSELRDVSGWTLQPLDETTGIAEALAALRIDPGGVPSHVLLVTDGAENVAAPDTVLDVARRMSLDLIALTAIGIGDEAANASRNRYAIRAVDAPAEALVGSDIEITVTLRHSTQETADAALTLSWDDREIESRTIQATPGKTETTVHFSHAPQDVGYHRVTATVAALTPDAAPSSMSVPVHVRNDKLRVLLVESHPRHETAFISRALAADSRIELTTMFLAKPVDGAWRNPLPGDTAAWQRYQLVIVGDVSASEFGNNRLAALLESISKTGTGLILLAGPRRFELLRSNELRSVVPTRMDEKPGEPVETGVIAGVTAIESHPSLQASLATHPVRDSSADASIWARLPVVPTAILLGPPKPTAEVLLTTPDGSPLVATNRYGKGRIFMCGIDGTWWWSMNADDGPEIHGYFWRQTAMETANRAPDMYIRSDRQRYHHALLRSGRQSILVESSIVDPLTGGVPEGASLSASCRRMDSSAATPQQESQQVESLPLTLVRGGDVWSGRIESLPPGEYELRVLSGRSDDPSDTTSGNSATHRFVVDQADLESLTESPNFDLLRRATHFSESLGGSFQPLTAFDRVLKSLAQNDKRSQVTTRDTFDITGTMRWPLLLILAMLLSAEWAIRKRIGLT